MEGIGNITWDDNSTYQGGFADNMLNGTGTYIDSQGNKLEGTWVNNTVSGHLCITVSNTGIRLEREVVNNELSKYVKAYRGTTLVYEGEMVNG